MTKAPQRSSEPAIVSTPSSKPSRLSHACNALGRVLFAGTLVATMAACSSPGRTSTHSEASAALAPTSSRAQALERSAAQAYAHGELHQAAVQYKALALRYTSLAQTAPQALAWLNWARVQAELGQPEAAIAAVQQVLTLEPLPASVQLLAHGRMAALLLANDPGAAEQHLTQAQALCDACAEQSALFTLRARLNLQQGDFSAARQTAASALQNAVASGVSSSDLANALRISAQVELRLAPGIADLANAIVKARRALALDQAQDAAPKVNTDLDLLARLYQAQGDTLNAQHHAALLNQAREAQEVQSKLQAPPQPPVSELRPTPRPATAKP